MIRKKNIAIAFTLLTIAGGVFYNKIYLPKKTYDHHTVQRGDLRIEVYGIGTMDGKELYNVSPRVTAKLIHLYADQGDRVRKGTVLGQLDGVDLESQASETDSAIQKAHFEVEAGNADLAQLQAKAALSNRTMERYSKLREKGFVSESEYDAVHTDTIAIEAQINSAKARIHSAHSEVERMKNARNAIASRLQELLLIAPADALILSRDAEVGESVSGGRSVFTLVNPNTVWVKAYIDERLCGKIRVGQKATITLRSHPEKTFSAEVKRIASMSDPVTEEREVDVAFDTLPTPFYIHEQADVKILTQQYKSSLVIPQAAVVKKDATTSVWINRGGKAHLQPVTLSDVSLEGKVAVLTGIREGDTLILPSQDKKPLSEGLSIRL